MILRGGGSAFCSDFAKIFTIMSLVLLIKMFFIKKCVLLDWPKLFTLFKIFFKSVIKARNILPQKYKVKVKNYEE